MRRFPIPNIEQTSKNFHEFSTVFEHLDLVVRARMRIDAQSKIARGWRKRANRYHARDEDDPLFR